MRFAPSAQIFTHPPLSFPRDTRENILEKIQTNSDYLLERCLGYDWEAVTLCCSLLILILKGKNQDQIQAAEKQLVATDDWRNTALHAACYFNPPHKVITGILRAARNAHIEVQSLLNDSHSTPLLIACTTGAPTKVIEEMLRDRGGTDAIYVPGANGSTTFEVVIRRYQMLQKVPKDAANSPHLDQITDLKDLKKKSPLFRVFWEQIETLLRAAWNSSKKSGESFLVLHAAAKVAELLPPVLTRLILRCFSSSRDSFALHLAVSARATNNRGYTTCILLRLVRQRTYFMQQLLEAHPAMAFSRHPRLPFLQGIVSGLQWHSGEIDEEHDEVEAGPLQHLWKGAPDVLYEIDPESGLRPFQLAARVQEENDLAGLNTIFSLLRLDPQAIRSDY
jgi:hypothetical protein